MEEHESFRKLHMLKMKLISDILWAKPEFKQSETEGGITVEQSRISVGEVCLSKKNRGRAGKPTGGWGNSTGGEKSSEEKKGQFLNNHWNDEVNERLQGFILESYSLMQYFSLGYHYEI